MTSSPTPPRPQLPKPQLPKPQLRSIGQVLAALKKDFPDISISKIRFLESEGLISPERAPSGYRRYDTADVERLRYILSVQRDHYLPLKVIREHLEAMDRGQPPPPLPGQLAAGAASGEGSQPAAQPAAAPPAPPRQPVRLTRAELLEASGLTEAALVELERTQIVVTKRGSTHYGRHLRAFKMSADREVGLVEQAIAPYVRRSASGRDVAGEVTQLVISFHAALVRLAMER
jgi:DNA-binding transcriptional MerR regulator